MAGRKPHRSPASIPTPEPRTLQLQRHLHPRVQAATAEVAMAEVTATTQTKMTTMSGTTTLPESATSTAVVNKM